MRQLFPLRPIQIIDTSFILSKKVFIKFFLIALIFVLPMQILAWAIEVAATQQSNIFAKRASQEYCKEYLGKTYATSSNPARYRIFAIQFLYQFISLLLCIFTRFLLGNMFNDTSANSVMGVLLFIYVGVWSVLSIRQSFSIPIFAFIVSFACVIFSFILVTTYFNGRVANEGFDLAVTIDEIEQEGRSRGKLLNVNAR